MRSNSLRRPVVYGRNFDLQLEQPTSINLRIAVVATEQRWYSQCRYVGPELKKMSPAHKSYVDWHAFAAILDAIRKCLES